MVHNKLNFQNKKKYSKEKLSRSIQEKGGRPKSKIDICIKKHSNNNIITLKRATSGLSSFFSRYESNIKSNKTINIDKKKELLIKNKLFFSFSDLGNITEILNKKDLNMKENNYFEEIDKIPKNKIIKNIIKVNTKIIKGSSPRNNSKIKQNKSYSKTKANIDNSNNRKKFSTNSHKKFKGKNNIESIRYNISHTQKIFFLREKLNFFIKKIKKVLLNTALDVLKKKYKNKFNKFKKNINLREFNNKTKNKSKQNLSSKKQSKPKNKDSFNNKINLFKQSQKIKNQNIIGRIGVNRSPSQISIKNLNDNNIIDKSLLQLKQKNLKMKLNQNSILNKTKMNNTQNKSKIKTYNNSKQNSKNKNKAKSKNTSQKKSINKKCNSTKKERESNNIKLKEKNNLYTNKEEENLIQSLNNNKDININNMKMNEDIQYYNTEINFKKKNGKICKIYENCLLEKNKNYEPKITNDKMLKNEEENIISPPSSEIKNSKITDYPFLKKNISPKKIISNKNNQKVSLNIKVNNFNRVYQIQENNIYFNRNERNETNPINNIFNNNLLNINIKNIFEFWKCFTLKKKILFRLINKNILYRIINKSKYLILRRILKVIEKCVIRKYFDKYKNIYIKSKILQILKNYKKKVIKCINIPIIHNNGYDIINNININNYINYSDLNKFNKKRTQSPIILSKLIMFSKENNNNNLNTIKINGNIFDEQNKNNYNMYNINNFNSYYNNNEDFIPFAQTDRLYYNNFNSINSSIPKLNPEIINLNDINLNYNQKYILNKENISNNNTFFNEKNKLEIIKRNNILIAQVNQLKMVFNLLAQHENKQYNLYECFHKWLYETKLNQKINNRGLFWSFSGNKNYNLDDENNQMYNKYCVNTYKDKNINNIGSIKKSIVEIGKYTPVRGIKNFRSKTNQKMSQNIKIFDYNDMNEIVYKNKNMNDYMLNNNCASLINIKNMNNNYMNIIYHKKKLMPPNAQYNNCFLENNTNNYSYMMNPENYNSINMASFNFYKNKYQNNNFNNNNIINISNNDLSNNISFHKDNYNKGSFIINTYNDFHPNIIQEKRLDMKKINKIEEKEINFALYKRNNSYNKTSKLNTVNIEEKKIEFNNNENIKIIYKKGKNIINNLNKINYNKKCGMHCYTNKNKYSRPCEKNIKFIKMNSSEKIIISNLGKSNDLINEFKNGIEQEKIKLNSSISYFRNRYAI